MDQSENAPLIPPEPEPDNAPESAPAPHALESASARETKVSDCGEIFAGQIPEPLRADSSSSPDATPACDTAQTVFALNQGNTPPSADPLALAQPGKPPAVLLGSRPPDRITPKPRAIFITAVLLAVTLVVWFEGSRTGWFGADPLEVARTQLLDLDQGHWRAAYELFSPRYRGEVSFETWRDMVLTHSRMFRTRELRFGDDHEWNGGADLEAHLVAESGDRYVARFTLVYSGGHWWVDDLHWGREPATLGQVTT